MTKLELFSAMCHSCESPASVLTIKGVTGRIMSVEREDGSGRCFNVTLRTNVLIASTNGVVMAEQKTVFVRVDR